MNEYEVRIYDISVMDWFYKKVVAYSEDHAMEVANTKCPYFIIESAKIVEDEE